MHDYLLSIFLGIVEGLTEFLPVSSTAHLRICEALLRIDLHDGFWKMYTIVIQLGAILALPVYFWQRLLEFVRTFPGGERGNRTIFTHPLSLTLIAFVVTAIPAWALTKQIGKNLENLCFSRHLALDVHHCRGTGRWNVASGRARVFIFLIDADDGRGHRI